MKDSKKFHSEKKILAASQYIKTHAVAWGVGYVEAAVIDDINIRQATFRAMHEAIKQVTAQGQGQEHGQGQAQAHGQGSAQGQALESLTSYHLLIDGNDFKPLLVVDPARVEFIEIPHTCIEGGDNLYASIAAASILAKTARDAYIAELCLADPELITRYDLLKNKGYGTAKHMAGLHTYGLAPGHRKSFGLCKRLS